MTEMAYENNAFDCRCSNYARRFVCARFRAERQQWAGSLQRGENDGCAKEGRVAAPSSSSGAGSAPAGAGCSAEIVYGTQRRPYAVSIAP